MPNMNIAESAMQKYLYYIKADYAKWSVARSNDPFVQDMIAEFRSEEVV